MWRALLIQMNGLDLVLGVMNPAGAQPLPVQPGGDQVSDAGQHHQRVLMRRRARVVAVERDGKDLYGCLRSERGGKV